MTVLYALTAQEPQSTEQVLAEHRARMNGETQTDARFEERVKKAVELRAGTEFALRDANDTFENGKAEAQKQYEGDLEPFRNNYLNAVEEKEKAEANAILWRGIRSRVGKVAENVVNLIEVRKNRQSGAKVLKL